MLEPYLYEETWGGETYQYWVYRSYMNSQIFNDHVAMPSYYAPQGDETADGLLDKEAEAIAAYETARPGVEVFPIDADTIITMAGAMHCITHEIPEEIDVPEPDAGADAGTDADTDTDADADADAGADDAGTAADGESDDGCGCSASGRLGSKTLLSSLF
jgi:hypothetical protein